MTLLRRAVSALVVAAALPAVSRADVPLPTGGTLPKVDFERHVMGLLSKTGCNLGSCHGSFQGKNGFRLSLFGYEPAMDHAALTRDNLGRRVNVVTPDDSLMLLKAVGATAHDGGMRFGKDTWVYNVLREWVRGGATWEKGSGAITTLAVSPPDFAIVKPDAALQVKVTATFADGTSEDITPFCDFKASDDSIASVSPLGQVTARQPGDSGLTVLYRGSVQAIRVLVPAAPPKGGYPKVPAVNYVDREVFAKLKLLNMVPAPLAADEVFLRRVYIDAIAQLPTPDEVRAFLADADPKKREKVIDKLLAHPLHAAVWATKLSDITGNNTEALERPTYIQPRRSQLWHDWLRKRVQDNVPYDRIVRDILTATSADGMTPEQYVAFANKIDAQLDPSHGADGGRQGSGFGSDYPAKKTLDLFWRRQAQQPIEVMGEKVAAAFLGVRLECAQCHKHPTDRWTQDEYWAFANLFSQVVAGQNQFSSREMKAAVDKENAARKEAFKGKQANNQNVVREMFAQTERGGNRGKPNPATGAAPTPKALGGPELPHQTGKDTRVALADWVVSKDNPFFARSFVNRVWAHYTGVGLVHPVDDFSLANAPTNPRLLDALAKDFADGGFDLRRLEKTILLSRTYQLGYETNAGNQFDKNNYSHAYVRPLMAEQVVDVLNAALGVEERFQQGGDAIPAGTKMVEVGASRVNNANLAFVLRIFGRPPRTTACDCERAAEPALPQSLFRMTDPGILAKFTDPKGRLAALAKTGKGPDELADELFLAALGRLPKPHERADAVRHIAAAEGGKLDALTDVMWALVNTREFILNH